MPEPTDLELVKGPDAARAVAEDPFWSTVVRRHGDVDVVVLPPEDAATPDVPADEPAVDAAVVRQQHREQMTRLCSELGLPDGPSHLDDVWFAGSSRGTLRWQGTAAFDGLDPVSASAVLERAEELLTSAGWHTLSPEGGVPRVLAGRPGRWVREEVQVLLASAGRVVVRVRSDLDVVGAAAAEQALGGDR